MGRKSKDMFLSLLMVLGCCATASALACKPTDPVAKFEIQENLVSGTTVGRISDEVGESLQPPYKEFFFLDNFIKKTFEIDYSTGLIKTKRKLDRETNSTYSFYVGKDSTSICINIKVLDVNEFAPEFSNPHKNITIPEGAPRHNISLGSSLDRDIGPNTIKGFRLVSGNVDYAFNVSGRMSTPQKLLLDLGINGTLDYEATKKYNLVIEVFDGGSPQLTSQMTVNVYISDTNDNHPVFKQSKYSATVYENVGVGTSVLEVNATDLDSGDNAKIRYSIDRKSDPDGHFAIDPISGVITVNKVLDYEVKKNYKILAIASDSGNQSNPTPAVVEIEILNINELPANIYITYLTPTSSPMIPENASRGYPVARVSVSDPESPDTESSNIVVTLSGGKGHFRLEATGKDTFKLLVNQLLDRELNSEYSLTLVAADSGSPPLSASKTLKLFVEDVNDNLPKFNQTSYEVEVQEMAEVGTSVLFVTASDADTGENARITYHLESTAGTNSDWFQVDSNSGLITTRGQVDCEVNSKPTFLLVASDHGSPPLSTSVTVVVLVKDINDKEPTFDHSLYYASVPENKGVDSCILQVNATDPDCGVNGQISYSISRESSTTTIDKFTIDQQTGQICIAKQLDHETADMYEFSIIAKDTGNFATTANIQISITDVNDNSPVFYPRNYSKNIQEGLGSGAEIITVQATDGDSGSFGTVTYQIHSDNSPGHFRINASTGTIYLRQTVPRGEAVYRLEVNAVDGGGLSAQSLAEVYISITGPNYNPPKFERSMYRYTVAEDVKENTFVGAVQAKLSGTTQGIRYSITAGDRNGFFKIDSDSGTIRTARLLDHDEYPSLLLNVMAGVGSTPLFGTTQVNITIGDVNDNPPKFSSTRVSTSVSEGINSQVTIYSAHATDKDSRTNGNGAVKYRLKENPGYRFTIDPISGEIRLATGVKLDYEQVTRHQLVVIAYDQGLTEHLTASMTVDINVQDANDNPPIFSSQNITVSVSEAASISSKFATVEATDIDDGENSRVTYKLIPSQFSSNFGIFPSDGNLYLKETLDREERDKYLLTVQARDHGQPFLTATAQVTVLVDDENDNYPVFPKSEYNFYVEENMLKGVSVGLIEADDKDTGNNAKLQFDFTSAQDDFSITNTGMIVTTRSLDRELHEDYDIGVRVQDTGLSPKSSTVNVYITVTDVNDHAPQIQNSQFEGHVDENRSKGVRVMRIVAKDVDAGDNGTITFALAEDGGDKDALKNFAIHPKSGWITTKEVLDYEVRSKYRFNVIARDSGSPSKVTTQAFVIFVIDDNDEAPELPPNITFYIVENIPTGTVVGRVEALDRDDGENGRVSYYIVGGNHFRLFSVDIETGELKTIREIDYEESSSHTVAVEAIDSSVYNPKSSIVTVFINVTDINDNAPVFEHDPVFLTIKENTDISTVIHTFTALDADTGRNGTVIYEIINTSAENKLAIDPNTGRLTIAQNIDYEEIHDISMIIRAKDLAPPVASLNTTLTVMIVVVDENDNAPVFESYDPFKVYEDEPVGYRVASIIASDADSNIDKSGNNAIKYSIKSGNTNSAFKIDENTAVLTIDKNLDRETTSVFSLRINARDQGLPYLQSEVTVAVEVLDVNDNSPQFVQSTYQANVTENSVIGTLVMKISATDDDDGVNRQLTYMIPGGIADDYFTIDRVSGVVTLATNNIDREVKSSYVITAYVQDGGSPLLYDMATLIINVTDVNDSPPVFKDSQCTAVRIPENTVQDTIHTFVAHDSDVGDNARLRYTITSGNIGNKFSINTESGVLSCKEPLDRDVMGGGDYELVISASDGKHETTCTLCIKVLDQNDNDPVFVKPKYTKLLFEDVAIGTTVVTVEATDADEGQNGNVTYSLQNDSDASLFEIDPVHGHITTKGLFDREKKSSYSFDVLATDGGQYDRRSEKVRVDVTIGDKNDNPPVFQELPYRKNVSYTMSANTAILQVVAKDKDTGTNGEVSYMLSSQSDANALKYFMINPDSGVIVTKTALSSSAIGYHNLQVVASDKGEDSLSSTGVVEITVGSPGPSFQFRNQNYTTSLRENSGINAEVIKVELDGSSSSVVFSFASGNDGNAFKIDASGLIRVNNPAPIDYEATHVMRLIVAAAAGGRFAYTTVWVNLEDVNDNPPRFSQDKYVTKVYEEMEEFTYVMQVTAVDADSPGPNSEIEYKITTGNTDSAFIIDPPYSGLIKTNQIIDYEVRRSYQLTIEARDNGADESLKSTCTVKISVMDTNDNPPKFPNNIRPKNISEDTEVGSMIMRVTANDVDLSPGVTYNFSSNPDNTFSIDRYSGNIRLSRPLDHERRKHYAIGLLASDGKHPPAPTTINIYVTDENDNAPVFSQQSYQVSVDELSPAHTTVTQVNASDADANQNAEIRYSLVVPPTGEFFKSAPSSGFYINEKTGIIYTNDTVRYTSDIIQLVVMATDRGEQPLSAVVAVYIQITSVNKHSPKFLESDYSATVAEDKERGYVVTHVNAHDKDTAGHNNEIDYQIVSGNVGGVFIINQKDGRIMLNSQLDRETIDEYNLKVMAQDRGNPPRNSTVPVQIIVQDVNDQIPYFEHKEYFVELNETFPSETAFLKIKAFDKDAGAFAKLYYVITSGNEEGLFIMYSTTGDMVITPNEHLDFEKHSYHKLIVQVVDCNGCERGSPRFANITTVHINVTDVNEYPPVFPVSVYFKGVNENMPLGSSVFEAHANDKDAGDYGVVTYTLKGTYDFSIHYKTGLVTTNRIYDYETSIEREFRFEISAKDKGGRSTTIQVVLTLVDVDEYAPMFEKTEYAFEIPGSATVGTFIGSVSASDEDGGMAGNVIYRFETGHSYFGINASSGVISVIHDLNKEVAKEVSRRKRAINSLMISASSGMEGSESASVIVSIDVDRTCPLCKMEPKQSPVATAGGPSSVVIIVITIVSVIAVCLLVIIVVILMRRRFRLHKSPPPSETPMSDDFDTIPQHTHHPVAPPHYRDVIRGYGAGNHQANLTTSSDISHNSGSSGRGSAEDDEDEELAMINSNSPSYLNNSNGFRKNMPDSGIQDDDNTSEPSIQNHQDYLARLGIDTTKITSNKVKSGGLTHSVESMHQFSDSGGGEGDGLEIDVVDYSSKMNSAPMSHHSGIMDRNSGMGYHEPQAQMAGSLSNVINSEEEYSGSYNWDYLLDWGPQYQPLAHVFSEIARLKDDTIQPKKQVVQIVPQQRQMNMSSHVADQVRSVPPLITNAPPKAVPQSATRSNRSSHSSGMSNMNSARNSTINTSLPSMPRSPISHESSFTSPALTPSFTPSLSPLATRSPSISPVNSGQGLVSSNLGSGPVPPRGRAMNMNNNKYGYHSSSNSEQELRI